MAFFRAYKAKTKELDEQLNVPIYFIESTAPDNVDDETPPPDLPEDYERYLGGLDSDHAVREIAKALAEGEKPNLVVMVHGFNNPQPDVLKMYTSALFAIARDEHIKKRRDIVCVGYRWPSEKMGEPKIDARRALPTLAGWILALGVMIVLVSLPLYFISGWKDWLGRLVEHVVTLSGWTAAGLMLTAILLRIIVYFRDNYRASNYGIPDLIQIVRSIDAEIMRHRERIGKTGAPRVQLSFIGHSMGGFVVTNAIRTLSNLFEGRTDALNSFGSASPPSRQPPVASAVAGGAEGIGEDSELDDTRLASPNIGEAFELTRFVLASPDIPAETLLSNRGNFLASALSRFDEAYLFSNEGDEVLRQISTLANYFVFPAKSRNHGFRLGNVEILSRGYGLIDPAAHGGFLQTLRVGNLSLEKLDDTLEIARKRRLADDSPPDPTKPQLPKRFTYLDCTDYVDRYDPKSPSERPLLSFARCCKKYKADARLPWYSHLHLLFSYVVHHQKPNVHGGYFEGLLSQQLIYRLACLGYLGTIDAYGRESDLDDACKQKQIRVLLSPLLRKKRLQRVTIQTGAQTLPAR
jgi:hypothetical protein